MEHVEELLDQVDVAAFKGDLLEVVVEREHVGAPCVVPGAEPQRHLEPVGPVGLGAAWKEVVYTGGDPVDVIIVQVVDFECIAIQRILEAPFEL